MALDGPWTPSSSWPWPKDPPRRGDEHDWVRPCGRPMTLGWTCISHPSGGENELCWGERAIAEFLTKAKALPANSTWHSQLRLRTCAQGQAEPCPGEAGRAEAPGPAPRTGDGTTDPAHNDWGSRAHKLSRISERRPSTSSQPQALPSAGPSLAQGSVGPRSPQAPEPVLPVKHGPGDLTAGRFLSSPHGHIYVEPGGPPAVFRRITNLVSLVSSFACSPGTSGDTRRGGAFWLRQVSCARVAANASSPGALHLRLRFWPVFQGSCRCVDVRACTSKVHEWSSRLWALSPTRRSVKPP